MNTPKCGQGTDRLTVAVKGGAGSQGKGSGRKSPPASPNECGRSYTPTAASELSPSPGQFSLPTPNNLTQRHNGPTHSSLHTHLSLLCRQSAAWHSVSVYLGTRKTSLLCPECGTDWLVRGAV